MTTIRLSDLPDTPSERAVFLSHVRGRKFGSGVFLADEVVAAAAEWRRAVAAVSSGRCLPGIEKRADGWHAKWRSLDADVSDAAADLVARTLGRGVLEGDAPRFGTAHDAWLAALRNDSSLIDSADDSALSELAANVAEWQRPLTVSEEDRRRLVFRLVPPPAAANSGDWRLEYDAPNTRMGFVALGQAAQIFPPLKAERFTMADAEAFLRTGARDLAAAGFSVEVPEGVTGEHLTAEADISDPSSVKGKSSTPKSFTARLHVKVDGEEVTAAEVRFLLDQGTSLVYFRDRWIEVDRLILREALRALERNAVRKLSKAEAVSFALGLGRIGGMKVDAAHARGRLAQLLGDMAAAGGLRPVRTPGLAGSLRDYQERGVAWLSLLADNGFGALLADDMGLGKTIQTISFVLSRRAASKASPRPAPALVVAPVSVTLNWMREIKRFAPGLRAYLHQGAERADSIAFRRECRRADVVVTGYSLLVRDFPLFRDNDFSAIVLDEAQTVKNADTKVARAAASLGSATAVRIALTGTPFENSADDLWSLESFLNPGLLGDRRDFHDRFTRQIREDPASPAAAKLRKTLAPFMLRRLKTDPGVAAELGPKTEIREYCPLSPEQRRAYEEALSEYHSGAASEGKEGRGRALALITRLKLVCDGEGKMARLCELLEQVFAAGESALVFTQYAKVGEAIRARLEDEFGRRFPFLHGSLAPAAREREISAFNGSAEPSAFILSLRAGGFGLNLTRANHVIHFDRWWNPAVENQATDRAHRIGQTKNVCVHAFITNGTIEDHVDALLERKRAIAGSLVASGEALLLGLSDEEFAAIAALDES